MVCHEKMLLICFLQLHGKNMSRIGFIREMYAQQRRTCSVVLHLMSFSRFILSSHNALTNERTRNLTVIVKNTLSWPQSFFLLKGIFWIACFAINFTATQPLKSKLLWAVCKRFPSVTGLDEQISCYLSLIARRPEELAQNLIVN